MCHRLEREYIYLSSHTPLTYSLSLSLSWRIRMALTPRCTAEGVKTSELIHEGAQDMLFSSAHITKWPPTDAHLPRGWKPEPDQIE